MYSKSIIIFLIQSVYGHRVFRIQKRKHVSFVNEEFHQRAGEIILVLEKNGQSYFDVETAIWKK